MVENVMYASVCSLFAVDVTVLVIALVWSICYIGMTVN